MKKEEYKDHHSTKRKIYVNDQRVDFDLDNYQPENTRETQERLTSQQILNKNANAYELLQALRDSKHTRLEEPFGDLNRLGNLMTLYHYYKEAAEGCPEELKPLHTELQNKNLDLMEQDIETYLDEYGLTWRNKYWEKREFLRKLSS